jgi:hypothetical protein
MFGLPTQIDFGYIAVAEEMVKTFTLENASKIKPLKFSLEDKIFNISPSKAEIAPKGKLTITVSINPTSAQSIETQCK